MKKVQAYIIIRQSVIFIFTILLLAGCTNAGSPKKDIAGSQKMIPSSPVQFHKPPASFNDTLVINTISILFYNPDSLQLDKIKAVSKKDNYDTEVHNCFYLMRNARIELKKYWPKIHIIETKTTRYLLFIRKDGSKTCIDLNRNGDMCGMFLFDGKKGPQLADMMNIDTALDFYFDNK